MRTGAKRALAGNPSSSSLSFPPREPQSRSSVSPWAWSPRAFLGHCTLRGSVPLTRAVNLLGCSGQVSPRVAGAVCARPGPPVPKTSVSGCVPRWTDIKPPVTGGPPSGLPFPPVPPPHHRSEHLLGARCVPGTRPPGSPLLAERACASSRGAVQQVAVSLADEARGSEPCAHLALAGGRGAGHVGGPCPLSSGRGAGGTGVSRSTAEALGGCRVGAEGLGVSRPGLVTGPGSLRTAAGLILKCSCL